MKPTRKPRHRARRLSDAELTHLAAVWCGLNGKPVAEIVAPDTRVYSYRTKVSLLLAAADYTAIH